MSGTWVKRVQDQMPDLIVAGLALYFAAMFGYAGVKALIGLQDGYIDAVSTTVAHSICNTFDLAPSRLTTLAAAIGELAPALHVAIVLTLLLTLPSWAAGDTVVLRTDIANLMLIAVAVGTSRYERRSHERQVAIVLLELEEHGVVASDADAPSV